MQFLCRISKYRSGKEHSNADALPRKYESEESQNEIRDSLWVCKENIALAHCVSEDFRMEKGIALDFKKKFGSARHLLAQRKKVGETAVLSNPPMINCGKRSKISKTK
ncbi:hypothetical protein ILUMI_01843 [Ignelater luminosus]|uniref:Uncharacterized protein n=1 Tax=Ignelater luminosus TaxID=2038154 RepID=A0A8K0GNT2_IGNLU|nr:hypothetical protein ILUMI_01843 [Ignelater luminosus]